MSQGFLDLYPQYELSVAGLAKDLVVAYWPALVALVGVVIGLLVAERDRTSRLDWLVIPFLAWGLVALRRSMGQFHSHTSRDLHWFFFLSSLFALLCLLWLAALLLVVVRTRQVEFSLLEGGAFLSVLITPIIDQVLVLFLLTS